VLLPPDAELEEVATLTGPGVACGITNDGKHEFARVKRSEGEVKLA
jgi:hypothetical protein